MNRERDLTSSTEAARRLRAVLLLAGRVGRNTFADGVARSVLDLPVDADRTVLDLWSQRLEEFARAFGLPKIRLLVAVDRNGALPRVRSVLEDPRVELEVVRDAAEYRGTAGVVRDIVQSFAQDDSVMVAIANQIQREPLADVFCALAEGDEGVSIVPSADGDLAGVFLLRCARMRDVPDVGFVDLKEQAIPAARGHPALRVTQRPEASALPIRTLDEYIRALRALRIESDSVSGPRRPVDPFAETWQPVFAIVEQGAHVAPGAVLQDSVVLAGGRVEAGAVVARSVVCDGGTVRPGQCVQGIVVTK